MMLVELKPLFARLNPPCTAALEAAAGLTLARNHYEISIEHYLHRLLDDSGGDLMRILQHFDIDVLRFSAQLDDALGKLKSGNPGRPVFSGLLTQWVQDGWLTASVTLGRPRIRSGALLLALIGRISYYAAGTAWGETLRTISRDALLNDFDAVVQDSTEQDHDRAPASEGGAQGGSLSPKEDAIARFCEDFTDKARAGKIDPVFGRDAEIRQMIDILARRRKNNPICVGDPGVGKTAVVEGLALRIVEGDVPEFLRDTRLLGLDLGLLEAGASVKGEFENRLRGVIDEIKASVQPVILFIDEAHMLIGAGGAAGGSDAANLLKPALARGELRTVAATTWAEYKKYFERDPALTRRFQLIKLDEPGTETALQILRGLKDRYEAVHGVTVRDDALRAAAELSDRYITGRLLPDKAVDLLDTAAARVRISLGVKPAELERLERAMMGLERERAALVRDQEHGHHVDPARLAEIDDETRALQEQHEALQARWQTERDAALRVLALRQQIARLAHDVPSEPPGVAVAAVVTDTAETTGAMEPMDGAEADDVVEAVEAVDAASGDERDALDAQLAQARSDLLAVQQDPPLVFTEVGPDTVAQVVSDWTGVPLGKMQRDSAGSVLKLADELKGRIRGQDQAIEQVAAVLKAAQSGLRDPGQPLGVFLLVGPSGVGKTETALAVADELFGGEQALTVINMSEFQEKHTVSRLVGSPPGYVGYGEGGVLTEAVRKRPYSVVLLDEVEKGHLDVLNLFYQVFDKGMLADGEGRLIDFSNTVIFLTSNLATDQITAATVGERPHADDLTEQIRPVLSQHFKPALLARMTVVPYYTLSADALGGIVQQKLDRTAERLYAANRVRLEFDTDVAQTIAARCTEVETGARNIDFILRKSLLPHISDVLLSAFAEQKDIDILYIRPGKNESWNISTET